MTKLLIAILTTPCVLLLLGPASAEARNIISWGTMYAVDGPFLGSTNPIRGVNGDTEAWVLKKAEGHLTTKGKIEVEVKGLIFKDGDPNDEPTFKAVVSCLTESDGTTPVINVATRGFPATPSGNSKIDDKIELPNPCVAPIVFITGDDETIWFAVTGFEKEEKDEED